MILNAESCNDAKDDFEGVEQQQGESAPAPEEKSETIAKTLQEVITDEVKKKVKISLGTIPDIVGKVV